MPVSTATNLPRTPPSSPLREGFDPTVASALIDVLHSIRDFFLVQRELVTSTVTSDPVEPQPDVGLEPDDSETLLEYKTVNEVSVILQRGVIRLLIRVVVKILYP